jgi:hypothetical protein
MSQGCELALFPPTDPTSPSLPSHSQPTGPIDAATLGRRSTHGEKITMHSSVATAFEDRFHTPRRDLGLGGGEGGGGGEVDLSPSSQQAAAPPNTESP